MKNYLVYVILLFAIVIAQGVPVDTAHSSSGKRIIAVMPFSNLMDDASLSWLGNGIAETLTTDLGSVKDFTLVERMKLAEIMAELELSELGAIDPASAQKAGKLLGAEAIVIGSFQKSGNTIRITARIVRVETGVVAETVKVTGVFNDIFSLQDQIAERLINNLNPALSGSTELVALGHTKSLTAYEHWIKGNEFYDKNWFREAREQYEKAIQIDSSFADAHIGLGLALFKMKKYDMAITEFQAAMRSRSNSAELHYYLGLVYDAQKLYRNAASSYQRAVALKPNYALAHYNLALILERNKDFSAAIKYYKLYVKYAPDYYADLKKVRRTIESLEMLIN